jgi:diguanylate cyclase (GGDEF)-like protein
VLKHAANIVHTVSHSRVTDLPLVARYGGEEIAVLLPNISAAGALRIADAIREALAQSPVEFSGQTISVTTSGGIAICPLHAHSAEALIAAADTALYQAKRTGRNRIAVASPPSTATTHS